MSKMALLLLVMLVPGVAVPTRGNGSRLLWLSMGARVLWSCWQTTPTRASSRRGWWRRATRPWRCPARRRVRSDAAAGDQVFGPPPRPCGAPGHLHLGRGRHRAVRDTAPLIGSQPTLRLVYGQGGTAAVFDMDAPGPSPTAAVAPAVAAARTDRSLAVVLGALGLAVGLWLGLTLAPGLTGPRRQG